VESRVWKRQTGGQTERERGQDSGRERAAKKESGGGKGAGRE